MDRTAGNSDWIVVKPFVTAASNCILPTYVVAAEILEEGEGGGLFYHICGDAYNAHLDPVSNQPYMANPTGNGASGPIPQVIPASIRSARLRPTTARDQFRTMARASTKIEWQQTAKCTALHRVVRRAIFVPITPDWAGTLRGDYYWQDYSWARVFNDNPYDRLRGYTNVNLTLIFTNQNGWQVMLYDKNMFNTTAITGDFLNSDDLVSQPTCS